MVWTLTAHALTKRDNGTTLTVKFTDGAHTVLESFAIEGFTAAQFKQLLRARIDTLTDVYAFVDTLSQGATIDPAAPIVTPPTPTAADIARSYLRKAEAYDRLKSRFVDAGIVSSAEAAASAEVVAFKKDVHDYTVAHWADLLGVL